MEPAVVHRGSLVGLPGFLPAAQGMCYLKSTGPLHVTAAAGQVTTGCRLGMQG